MASCLKVTLCFIARHFVTINIGLFPEMEFGIIFSNLTNYIYLLSFICLYSNHISSDTDCYKLMEYFLSWLTLSLFIREVLVSNINLSTLPKCVEGA
jgi:hypothetical protein